MPKPVQDLIDEVVADEVRHRKRGHWLSLLLGGLLIVSATIWLLRRSGSDPRWDILAVLFVGIATVLLPSFRKIAVGKDGLSLEPRGVDELLEKLNNNKQATSESYTQLDTKIAALVDELRILKSQLPQARRETSVDLSTADAPSLGGPDTAQWSVDLIARTESVLPAPKINNDTQKGRFGGNNNKGSFRLTALVEPSNLRKDWCSIKLSVISTTSDPLVGHVVFFWIALSSLQLSMCRRRREPRIFKL